MQRVVAAAPYVSLIAATDPARYVYDFSEGSREMRDLLGGKGANLAEMIRVLGPERVPAGFTISTEACRRYLADEEEPAGLFAEVAEALDRLERRAGRRLGDAENPLLVSVRSGAPISMLGMMDTVLNLGLTDDPVNGLADRTRNPRFAWDSYRRVAQRFGNVVRGIPGARFEAELAKARGAAGVDSDAQLDTEALRRLTARFKAMAEEESGRPLPADPVNQLQEAIRAVFASWTTTRAVEYRRLNRIPDDVGTAANVQAMVFGNTGPDSGSGVAFSRDELTGAPAPSGDFLANAQGEDVVSGTRRTEDLDGMAQTMGAPHADLLETLVALEQHFGDMQDVEFTVEEGRLYLLQTRAAKRPAQAAVRFAVDAVAEGLLDRAAALMTIDAGSLETLL
ncbi:MAG: PEP/pyruvate-binding domain-containing protein, partial [Solirubrobacterales bacterium]